MTAPPLRPGLRLLYLPNEVEEGDQVGPRGAFAQMQAAGALARVETCSYLVQARRLGAAALQRALTEQVAALQPHWLLWQHVGAFPGVKELVKGLRAAAPGLRLLYHEGDLYGRGKPLPAASRALMQAADAVALVGRGHFAAQVRALTAAAVLYSPSAADTQRFGQPWPARGEPDFNVVMIGNHLRSRLPWRRMPGAATRAALARRLGQRHGRRFGLFGQGWRGFTGWQGPLPYAAQEAALRRGRIAASWGHFDAEAGYFSDRLPIGLLSGVPQISHAPPDAEALFGPEPPLTLVRSVDDAVRAADALLAESDAALAQRGLRAAAFARAQLVAEVVYPRLLAEADHAVQQQSPPRPR